MLYHLLYVWLQPHFGPPQISRYFTTLAAFPDLTALLLMLVLGPWMIRRRRDSKVGQCVREEIPGHQPKAGTPTMGGLLILVAIVVPALLWTNLTNPFLWLLLLVLVALR